MNIVFVLLALASGLAQAEPVTENAARSYVASAFITGAAPAILSDEVRVGPTLRARLSLPERVGRDAVYRALVAMTEGKRIRVGPSLKQFPARPQEAALSVEAGDVRLLVRYDLRANNIDYVDLPAPGAGAGGSARRGDAQAIKVAAVASTPPAPTVVMLRPVLFEFARATLGEDAQALLEPDLAERLRLATSIRLTGHADAVGSTAYNLRLSGERALAVRERLLALGVEASRIQVVAAGGLPSDPCAGVAPRAAYIDCLAPERRVDIAVELPAR